MNGRHAAAWLFVLALSGGLLGCEDPPPTPRPAAGTPSPSPAAPAPAGPTATLPNTAVPTVAPTVTLMPVPTASVLPTATEGPVRTPVGGAAGPEFSTALAAMDAVSSYRYSLQLALGPTAARYVLNGSGQYQAPGNFDTNVSANGFSSEILVLDGTTYVRNYGVWHKGAPDPTVYPLSPPPDLPRLLGLLTYTHDAGLVGDGNETLNGTPVRHYRFLLRPGNLLGPAPDLGIAGGDLWADATTHRFIRLSYNFGRAGAPSDNDGVLQIDFSDYGSPVVLTPPTVP